MSEVVIARFSYRHDAEFAQGFLADAGLPSWLTSDDAGGVDLSISFLSGASLSVPTEHARAVVRVLEQAGVL